MHVFFFLFLHFGTETTSDRSQGYFTNFTLRVKDDTLSVVFIVLLCAICVFNLSKTVFFNFLKIFVVFGKTHLSDTIGELIRHVVQGLVFLYVKINRFLHTCCLLCSIDCLFYCFNG